MFFTITFIPALNKLAIIHIKTGEYIKSIHFFKKIIKLRPNKNIFYYNIACLYSKQNKVEEAVSWLKRAIIHGYANWDLIKSDKDLENIRSSSAYIKLIEEGKKN